MKTKIISFFIVAAFVLILGTAVPVQSFTSPTANPTNGNTEAPLDTSLSAQWKRGTLAIGKSSNAASGYMLDVSGNIRAKGLSVLGGLFVKGNIKSDPLKGTTTANQICANTDGTIVLCPAGQAPSGTVTLVDESNPGTYQVTVPQGVTEVTIEIWGAGGAGYHYINDGGTGSNGCSGTNYIFASTATTLTGAGVTMTANPGKCAYKSGSTYNGGTGGTASISGTVSSQVTATGGNGSTGAVAGTKDIFACNSSSYEAIIAAAGGAGGAGGTASSGGAGGAGGAQGVPGTSTRFNQNVDTCIRTSNPPSMVTVDPVKAGNGNNGQIPGGGGGGAGGRAGQSSINSAGVGAGCAGEFWCGDGSFGYPGGGAGGYAKAVLTGLSGNTFTFSVGKAYRNDVMYACNPGDSGNACERTYPLTSGWGGNGKVKITYNP